MKLLTMLLTRIRGARTIATLLLCALAVVAQTTTTKIQEPPLGFGIIKGRVVNESGQPLANAVVTIARFEAARSSYQSAITDREGKFELTGLERVTYRLSARLPAYTPLLQEPDGEETTYRAGDTVTLVLVKGGVITGTVTNQAGEPVVGVWVHARLTRGAERLPWLHRILPRQRLTDDRGVYRIYGLPPGTYVVSAGGPAEQMWRAGPFAFDAPTFAPAASTRDTAEEYTVHSGQELGNVDIRYRNEPGRTISGRASGPASSEARGFGIRLTHATDGGGFGYTTGQPSVDKGFVFGGLADGDYDIIAFSSSAGNVSMWSESKRIKVNGADVSGIELVTQPLSAVSGKVVLQELKTVECADKQRPIVSETLVAARQKTTTRITEVPFWTAGSPSNADAEGNVVLRNLVPGQYYFKAQFSGKAWYLDSITLPAQRTSEARAPLQAKPVDAAKTWTMLKSGERLSGLTITLAQGAASVQGELTPKEGEKLSVYLVPAERERVDDVLRFFTTVAGVDGKIELNNVAPGRYWVLVTSEAVSLNKLRSPDATEVRSRLRRAAEAAKSEIELKPCQNLANFQPPVTPLEKSPN